MNNTIRKQAKDMHKHFTKEDMYRWHVVLYHQPLGKLRTTRYHYLPMRMSKMKNSDTTKR